MSKFLNMIDFLDALLAGALVFFVCVPTWQVAAVAGILSLCVSARRIILALSSGKKIEERMVLMENSVKRIQNKFGIGA